MNRKHLHRFVTLVLVIILMTVDTAVLQPVGGVEEAHASIPGLNLGLGLFRVIGAGNRRRRVYREAHATQKDMDAYYDSLIAKTRSIRNELIAGAKTGDTPPSFTRSYVKIEATLEAERAAVTKQIEAEKNEARRKFNRALGQEIFNILTASPGGQHLIGRVRETLSSLREAAVAVKVAANQGKPLKTLKERLASRYADIPALQNVIRNLGSLVGHKLDRALGGILSRTEKAMGDVERNMGQAIELIDQLDATVAHYHEQERRPTSLVEDDGPLGELVPVDRANAVLDVTSSAYAGAAALHGMVKPGQSRRTMRDRIRSTLLQQRIEGLNRALTEDAGRVFCNGVGRGEYEVAARQLGLTPKVPSNPAEARYIVCYQIQTLTPIHAHMVGAAADATPTPDGPTPTSNGATLTPGGPTPTHTPTPEAGSGSIVIAQGAFVEEWESSEFRYTENTAEMRFYPEGGPVKGIGVLAGDLKWPVDDKWYEARFTFEFEGESFMGEEKAPGQAAGQVSVTTTFEKQKVTETWTWQAEYADGKFEGFIWDPENPEPGEEIHFSLTY